MSAEPRIRTRLAAPAITTLALATLCGVPPTPVAAQERPTLTPDDYGRWERLGQLQIDPTGTWLATSISRVDETREIRVHRTSGEGEPIVLEHATSPVFSRDGRWLAYRRGVSPDSAEKVDERVQDRLGLVDLNARSDTALFEITSLSFRDDGAWLAARGVAAADSIGADLMVMNPSAGTQTLIGNVDAYAWQDEGRLLAATLKTAGGIANGVVLFDPDAGTLRTLDSRDAEYRALTWLDESSTLAVLRSVSSEERDEGTHDVLLWADASARGAPRVLAGVGRPDLADTLRITEYAGIDFSADGRTLFVGLRPWDTAKAPAAADSAEGGDASEGGEPSEGAAGDPDRDEVGPADVQIWHWNDDDIIRAQEYRSNQLSRRTFLAAWHVDEDRLVRLGDELEEPVEVVADGRWGVVADYDPYLFERRFGAGTADWYRVDVRTGERVAIASAAEFGLETREESAWALVYADDAWHSVALASLERRPMAGGRSFTRALEDYDFPGPRPSWGVGGWVDGQDAVLLYDRNDVWRAGLTDGSASRLTRGAEEDRLYRLVSLDPDAGFFAAPTVPADGRAWLSVFDVRSKESGYARVSLRGEVEQLLLEDARVVGLAKARDAERYALRMERWDDSPDVFVGGASLGDLVQVTRTNPFQSDFAWGRTELLGYTTDAGHDLQAILVYPADFQPGRRYPLILYQYERLSDNVHAYDVPDERDYYNYQTWSQQGYFVLMPDIVYEPGRPGPSALDAVEHALDAAVATGHVDPERMGLIGHSWGGYQASYLPTRTSRFAASVAGAAITNFLSFMGAVHWNGGLPETGHWETGQARMAAPYWEDMEGHLESSPANFITDLDTPMLLMHGDADGVVDFYQGMEFYNYARRAGKEVVLLVYPGADHGLTEEEQQVDYHRRILEWFGHWLKGDPAPKWITDGESWVERAKRMEGKSP